MAVKSTTPSNEQLEIDQLAEAELERLQKQVRKLEKDRASFLTEKKNAAAKRDRLIATLKKERLQLQERLNAITTGPHAQKELRIEKKIRALLKRQEALAESTEEKKIQLWELNGHIKKLEKEIKAMQEKQSTEQLYSEQLLKVRGEIEKLENQLDVVQKRCGEVMSENTNLRSSIDHLLLERSKFNEMWQKMVTKLELGKKLIMDLIEQSVAAYEQREELCNKIQSLETKGHNEQTLHLQEMRELQRKLDHDMKLKDFFAIKGNHRVNAELEAIEAERNKMQQEQADKHLSDLQNIIQQIQNLSNENDLDKLSRYFTKQEEENFALFSYVNELSYEVEVLNESVQHIKDDIDKQKIENETKKQTQRDSTIEVLEENLNLWSAKAQNAELIHIEMEKKLQEMLSGIETLFSLLSNNTAPVLELLLKEQGITIHNVRLFLGIIKRRTNHVINRLNYSDQPSKILAKRDRVPKFNINDMSSGGGLCAVAGKLMLSSRDAGSLSARSIRMPNSARSN